MDGELTNERTNQHDNQKSPGAVGAASGRARQRGTGHRRGAAAVRQVGGTVAPQQEMMRLTRADVEKLLVAAAGSGDLDLRGADLRLADLSDLDLPAARLDGAQLDGARLERARLGGAWLRGAQLKGAQLAQVDLAHAHLEGACLEGAELGGAVLSEASLDRADLSGAGLQSAALQGASLVRAHLAHARLGGARLRGAHLDEATLWGASLRGAELEGAHLSGADLHEADLDGAFFAGSALADADLALVRWQGLRVGEEASARRTPLTERPEAYRTAADAYRRLRQACSSQGLYDQAGELYRREMRMRQQAHGCEALVALLRAPLLGGLARGGVLVTLALALGLLWLRRRLAPLARPMITSAGSTLARMWAGAEALARPWRSVVRWGWHAALEVLCGHGERVGRVLVAAVVVIVALAFVYLGLGQLTEPNGQTVTSFWHALYFSACSFSSIGYASFAPSAHSLAKWLGVAESFTGNFLLALFLVTFTRKLTR